MPMQNYNDYEAGNARMAGQMAREVYAEPSLDEYEAGNASEARSISDMVARRGRGSDTMAAHVTPGDVVVPRYIVEKDPSILGRIKKNFDDEGADYRDHIVGSEFNNINPETGMPEFGFFSKLWKTAAPILGAVAGSAFGPVGSAVGAGLGSKLSGGSNTQALLSGAGAGLGGAFLGRGAGDVAGNLTTNSLTRGVGEGLAGTALGGASMAGVTGALTGQSISNLVGKSMQPIEGAPMTSMQPQGESLDTSRPDDMAIPGSLSDLNGLSDIQRTSALATQGTEGQGVSDEGQSYFLNQLRRRLTDADSTPDEVIPVEQNYLKRMGVTYEPGSVKSILEGIARKQQSGPAKSYA